MKKTTSPRAKKAIKSEESAAAESKTKRVGQQPVSRSADKLSPQDAVGFLKDYENLLRSESEQKASTIQADVGSDEKRARSRQKAADSTKDIGSPIGNESKKFAETVRRMRRLQELSQEELAERAGLHRNFVGAIERGEMSVSLENAERLARALGVRLKDLL